jgi:hypothetical protein
MNLTEERLRAALLETAEEIPADAVPPLDLPSDDLPRQQRRWLPALAAAAAVFLTIGLSVALAGGSRPKAPLSPQAASALAQFPPYYVALQTTAGGNGGNYQTNPDHAVVNSTMTGGTLATIAVPKPYATFAFVQGTASPREFILGAQRLSEGPPVTPYPATRLYLLRLNPSARAGRRVHLSALRVPLLPTGSGYELCWISLSPNGHLLATISTTTATNNPTKLQVFDLVTGGSRTWVLPRWAGREIGQDVTGPPTWDADSRTLAFFSLSKAGALDLVQFDTSAPAASFGADTRSQPLPRPPRADALIFLPGSPLLTPDGQHVIESVVNVREANHPPSGPLHAFAMEDVDLRTGAVTRLHQHGLIPYVLASDPSGSAVIVALGSVPRYASGFVIWTARGTIPIQLPPDIIAVAW